METVAIIKPIVVEDTGRFDKDIVAEPTKVVNYFTED